MIQCAQTPLLTIALSFSGHLDIIELDAGGGVYSGTLIGNIFFGFIDDVSFGGEISNDTTLTSFSCCIAAGGLSVSNDDVLDSDGAARVIVESGV